MLRPYRVDDPIYMVAAAEYVVATNQPSTEPVLAGSTGTDNVPTVTLRFGEYSQTPELVNSVTYFWRVRLICIDGQGRIHNSDWTPIESIIAGSNGGEAGS